MLVASRCAVAASILVLTSLACSRESAPEVQPLGSAPAEAAASVPTSSAAAAGVAPSSNPPDRASPTSPRCHPSNPSMARFWSELDKQDLKELVEGHVAGAARGEAGCVLAAFMSGVNVLSFTAPSPKLKPMDPKWKGGDTGKPPAAFSPELREVMPEVGQPQPLLEEKFEDGEGNFMTRKLYRTTDGRFVLVLDYAG